MSDDRVRELEKEARDTLKEALAELKRGQENILSKLDTFAKRESVDDHHERISRLENSFSKIIGGLVVFQIVGGFIIAIVLKLMK